MSIKIIKAKDIDFSSLNGIIDSEGDVNIAKLKDALGVMYYNHDVLFNFSQRVSKSLVESIFTNVLECK